MRTILIGALLLGLAANANPASAGDEDRGREAGNQQERSERRAYLGVAVEALHPSLFGHLNELLHGGEGVRVVAVAEGSPADEAGLMPNDILLRFDDQRVFTPEQLAKLVGNDKPGSDVTIGIIRAGKSKTIEVTLAERQEAGSPRQRVLRPPLAERRRRNGASREKRDPWESFDSLTLSRIDEDRFSATIKYRNNEGKIATHRFKGTREEIEQDIENESDLPANERRHLLRALGLQSDAVPLDMPELWVLPDGRVILEVPEGAEEPEAAGSQRPL